MTKSRSYQIYFCFILLFSGCSESTVEQIEVNIPKDITIPKGMVYIPNGDFIMGNADDPRTKGGIKTPSKAYLIDRFEVTQERYMSFNPAHTFGKGKGKYPLAHVNFFEAEAFCKHAGNRLPTEAEWEKAARGVDGRKWPWLNYVDHPNNGFSGFIPENVNKREGWISPYGLYGMGHNVWEWTADDYNYSGMPESEKGLFKVIRGGVLQTHLNIKFSPTYFRNWMEPKARYNFLGFRCARDVQ
ncbi:MAG: formylglycine-generating enzyme family protein [Nitrospinales bacterium]